MLLEDLVVAYRSTVLPVYSTSTSSKAHNTDGGVAEALMIVQVLCAPGEAEDLLIVTRTLNCVVIRTDWH